LPTNFWVKSLIVLSCVTFSAGILIYIINESIKKPIISVIMITMILALFGLYVFKADKTEKYNLSQRYANRIIRYEGSEYGKGFEIRGKTDSAGLVHSLWSSMVLAGESKRDFLLMAKGFRLWLLDLENYDLRADRYGFFDPVSEENPRLGDVCFYKDRFFVCVQERTEKKGIVLRRAKWASSEKGRGFYVITEIEFEKYVSSYIENIYRWKYLETYSKKDMKIQKL
ncbi:MAG: hypothetical protein KBT47_05980, partial [Armatimonadetes bacterium]|nr:hypothetical protein [Candidatus Hippobium faecium]